MRAFLPLTIAFGCGLSVVVACSGKAVESSSESAGSDSGGASAGATSAGATSAGATSAGTTSAGAAGTAPHGGTGGVTHHEPANHRATATACDHVRATNDPGVPDGEVGPACRSHADCTAGENGRCVGNGHDGWHCTYDACFADADCPTVDDGPRLCACGAGDRSDNNVCLTGNCRVDADCGAAGYCSPSLGSCGNYFGFEGYFCHTPDDECSDDSDCGAGGSYGAPYCAFMPSTGHWQCSTAQCVG